MTSSRNIMAIFGIPEHSKEPVRTLISVPLFHVTGCNTQMMVMVYIGGTSVILPTFTKQAFLSELVGEKINYLITVPAIYAMILQMPEFQSIDTSTVKWLAYGGAPIAPTLVKALKAAFPKAIVANGFGMTETTSIITALPDQDPIAHADSVGYAVRAIDIAVALHNGSEDTGELLARGANVTTGYWNKPQESSESWHDGWYWTGDIVRVDDRGRVFLVDRKKDIIIRGGENISSVEIEAALAAIAGVAEAAALAVPDDVLGEKLGVLVRTSDPAVTVQTVFAYCQDHLTRYKVPQYIQLTSDPLPRSAAGKILKKELRGHIQWGAQLW